MPVTWEIRGAILIVTIVGQSNTNLSKALDEALDDPRFRPGTSLLLDVRLSADNPSSDEFQRRIHMLRRRLAQGLSARCAVVIGPKPHQFGLARMASAYCDAEGMVLQIFTDIDEASRWLERAEAPEVLENNG